MNVELETRSVVYNMDCMEGMKQYPDKYFDLAVVDPPYGINADKAQNNAALSRLKANGKSKSGRGWKLYKDTEWDKETPDYEYWIELFRVSKNQIVWGANYMTDFLPPSMGWIIWDKQQRDFSLADGEMAWTSFNKAMRFFDMSRGKALAKNNEEGGRFHPTQKPIKLYDFCFQFAKVEAGAKILDTHGGSMSSVIACLKGGYNITCFEIDREYYNKGKKRIEAFISQGNLFMEKPEIKFIDTCSTK